ncbi:carbohydrate ABC transporter permease [Kineothrix sp. MB12-C1]|uniref:carbohydrate ABC transporter permease n=1 Tax=Kineothrix sp. MB12-C1 TaxID=3070215 RepID=UPI0027D28893|nr:sugar ABC transporter permease [Kineothrix sp. MB12-C1]WMC91574.1 sugar ABC transporter permease [Kineothrix sp. MB12-C1]
METIKTWKRYWNKPDKVAYIFMLPSLLVLLIFAVIPLVTSLIISLFDMNIFFTDTAFAGVTNFARIFQDKRFWNALLNTVVFVVFEVPLQIVIGLLVANALVKATFFNKVARSIFFLPVVCSMAAVGIVWSILLDTNIGFVPYLLEQVGIHNATFFRNAKTAMPTVVAMTIWKNFGYTMSILVVGIQGISRSYYEAAEIDGAGRMAQFFRITLPLLRPTLGFCMITNTIGSLQVFDQVYVTTQGGPQFKTETLVQYIYKTGFNDPYDLGYACALSVILLCVILVISLPMYKKMFMDRN